MRVAQPGEPNDEGVEAMTVDPMGPTMRLGDAEPARSSVCR